MHTLITLFHASPPAMPWPTRPDSLHDELGHQAASTGSRLEQWQHLLDHRLR